MWRLPVTSFLRGKAVDEVCEIADRVIKEVESGKWDFIKLNFPNGDMVGHTGNFQAVVCSMEGLDLQIGRIHKAVMEAGGVMVITADHGNADDMFEHGKDGSVQYKENGDPKAKTSHSLNPVPASSVTATTRVSRNRAQNRLGSAALLQPA